MALDIASRRHIRFAVPKIGTPHVVVSGGCDHWIVEGVSSTDCIVVHDGPASDPACLHMARLEITFDPTT